MTSACRPLAAWRRLAAPLCAAFLLVVPRHAVADTCSGLGFGQPAGRATGAFPSAVAVGDYDRDGKLDLATANQGDSSISVFLGDGTGALGSPTSRLSAAGPVDMAAADLDRNGWLDLVVASGDSSKVILVHAGLPGAAFNTGVPTAVPVVPTRIALADFNRDAWLDLVVVSAAGHEVLVLKGTGSLGFDTATPLADLVYSPSAGPAAVAPGDFNRDGRLDLAVGVAEPGGGGRVDLFLGNGAGSLVPGIPVNLGVGPRDLSAGDVNRDGMLDLVVAQTSGNVAVLLAQANGTFLPATPVAVGGQPTRVAVADLDRDGALDLVVLDAAGARLASFEGGGTAPNVFGPTPYTASLVGPPSGLALGDFTSDGRPDLATALQPTANQAVVVPNLSGTPCLRSSFEAAPRAYWVPDGPVSTAAADFDGDGRVDLAVATTNDGYVRVRRGVAGGFEPFLDLGQFSSPPRGLATADFDFDGRPDLVAALGNGTSGRVQLILHDASGALTIGPSLPAGTNTAAVAIGDFDGNGAPDVAAISEADGGIWVFVGNGAGALAAGVSVLSGLTSPRALVVADFTGDGLADIAVAESGAAAVHVFGARVDAAATLTFTRLTSPNGLAVGAAPESIAAADLDGDGQLDLVTANDGSRSVSVVRRSPGGGFLTAQSQTVGLNPKAVALLDLTGDTLADIAVATGVTRTLTVLRNGGGGAFSEAGNYAVRGFPRAITPVDVDADGRLDLAVTCQTADSVVVLVSRPPALEAAPRVAVGARPRAAVAADVDRDGDLDLAVANLDANTVSLLRNDGAGRFAPYASVGVGAGPGSIVAADFNRDGRVDLALNAPIATPPGVSIVLASASTPGAFVFQGVVPVGTLPDALAVGDFNRDGALDLAVCDKVTGTGVVHILLGNGSGGFAPGGSVAVGGEPTAIVAGDFNRDGALDLAVANEGPDNVQVLTREGETFSVRTLALPANEFNPVSIAAGDFDGDGDADLVAAAFLSDRLHVYRNDGGIFTSSPVTSRDAPHILRSVTVADVNLDGRPDILGVATGLDVFRGRGSLDFEAQQSVLAGLLPQAAVVGEFSGDGWPDVAVVNEDSGDVSLLISSPCRARRLEVALQPAACETGLAPYAPAAEVRAYDEGGNVAACAGGTVVPSIVPGTGAPGALLGGPDAGGRPLANGVASFTGLSIDRAGRRYRLQFSLDSLPPVRTRSFTLGPVLQIFASPSPSICPGTATTFSTEGSYDEYSWILTPDVSPPASTHTPTVTLRNPPLTGAHTLALSARVDGCLLQASQAVFGGPLQSTSLQIDGLATVCVDCIGGTVTPVDLGGGPVVSRQWGFRTVAGTGAVTDIPGETGESYVLKGANFPGPGLYRVVVRTTPTCGTPTISEELQVEIRAQVPDDEVQHLAASTRGGENLVQWVNSTSGSEVRIRWNKAPAPNGTCLFPTRVDSVADGGESFLPPLPTVSSFPHTGLALNTPYCYTVFVNGTAGWSKGRTVRARPFDDSGALKWAYSTGATAVVPPVVSAAGILVMSNDRTVHALTRGGATGGRWPPGWVPSALTGVAHSRSPVVSFGATSPVFPGRSILFTADDAGDVHAIDAATGQAHWGTSQGKPLVGAPGGMFTQFNGVADLIIVGTHDTTGPNELRGLAAQTGTLVGTAFTAGGTIGAISGSPAIDYANRLVHFTSRSHAGGDTVWCVGVNATSPFVPGWSRNLGDVDASPVLRGGRVYVGTADGVLYSLQASNGQDERSFATGDGPVKGFVFPDRRNDDLIFATNTTVWSVSDTTMTRNWKWTLDGLNPSIVLHWPQTNYVYVGGPNGVLYQLDFSDATPDTPPTYRELLLGDGLAQIGAPSLDVGVEPPDVSPDKKLLVVGSEAGVLYGVEVPF